MFEQTLTQTTMTGARARSTLLGFATQCTMLTAAVLVPLVFPDSLPKIQTVMEVFTLRPPGPPPGPPPAQVQPVNPAPRPTQLPNGVLTIPVSVPPKPAMIEDAPLTQAESFGSGSMNGVVGGLGEGIAGALASAILTQVPAHTPAPAPPPAPPVKATAKAAEPLRVSRGVQEAMILHKVIPPYPALARTARISGTVQLVGHIGTDGRIRELQLISGHPLLAKAALDAVSQWVYRPTLLNGEPVEVIAPITVTFTLQ